MAIEERQRLTESVAVLETSRDRAALQEAATALATTKDPGFLAALENFLSTNDGLARLDNIASPSEKTWHLARVFRALEQHSSGATANLCLRLINEPDFLADDDRKIYLLPALAAVRPMSDAAAEVFRQTNEQGYYNLNVRLLVSNGSPNALALFEEMIRDAAVPAERRVDGLHAAVLPHRTELPVLQSADRLLSGEIEGAVAIGLIETIFDFRSREWFGPSRNPPTPPPWEGASDEALQFVLALAIKVKERASLPPALQQAVNGTVMLVRGVLATRRA
ncbi:MAG: hypothetical protein ACXWCY_03315 [Burkholderiales bacterium]